jgi:hypothetical protein
MALFSNTLAVVRRHLLSAIGDLLYGQAGTTGATTTKIHAPFLWQADDYYKDHKYHVYVYAGTNIGLDRRVTGWANTGNLLTVHTAYAAACDATSYIELHRIFTVQELHSAINQAIEHAAGKYLVDLIDDTTITLVADTYEYALPTSFLYLNKVTTESAVASDIFYKEDVIDFRDWDVIKAYPPTLKLDKNMYSIVAGKDLRLEGHGTQALVSADTDVIYLPPAWLIQKAITFLPQNKIQSHGLRDTYLAALRLSERIPRTYPAPQTRSIVE